LGKGVVHWGPSWREVLEDMEVSPDFLVLDEAERESYDYIHRRVGEMDVYFVRNRTMAAKSLDCVFRVDGTQVRIWNPVTGLIEPAFRCDRAGGRSRVRVNLPAAGSMFVGFSPASGDSLMRQSPAFQVATEIPVTGPWSLSFPAGWGVKQGTRSIAQLASWTDSDEVAVKYFSGTATYATTIELPENVRSGEPDLSIDLGEVREMAEVFLNDKSLGIVWTPPYRVKLGDAARSGKNELRVEVTNLWANRLIGDLTHPEHGIHTRTNMAGTFKAGDEPLPSGLLGPVRIVTMQTQHHGH
jgi:hypothetical protein